jgi:serine/threonine-protein kinase HipA
VTKNLLYLWWLSDPSSERLIGTLRLLVDSGQRSNGVSLEYDDSWLANGFALSEDLPLQRGEALPSEKDSAVGAVDDARPDRWGERVIRHLLKPPRLSTLDFLYYAGDQRFGALGVSQSLGTYKPFSNNALPTLADVPEIFHLVKAIENGEAIAEGLKRLISPGTTLGGARPKALVAIDSVPWVIKFSEHGDAFDSPSIEHATLTLAKLAGINSCESRLFAFPTKTGEGHALLVKRFDREGSIRRHAVSAKVALSASGSQFGYPELSLLLRRRGDPTTIEKNAEQVFRRMIFNILIDNTDDHEKNHVLILRTDGLYELSPAFDVLPSGLGLGYQQMRIGKQGTEGTIANALSEISAFRLSKTKATAIASEVAKAVNRWRQHFIDNGVSLKDVETLASFIDGPRLLTERLNLLQ